MNPYANNQEVFDKAARHLLTQKTQALNNHGKCVYRTKSGLACAIGGCIPDDMYDPVIDNIHGGHGRTTSACVTALIHEHHVTVGWLFNHCGECFLNDLQEVHDNNNPEDWPLKLADLAEEYDLDSSVLAEFEEIE